MQSFWASCLERLQQDLSPQQFSTWIKPLKLEQRSQPEECLHILAPNSFVLKWVKERYLRLIEELALAHFSYEIPLTFGIYQAGQQAKAGGTAGSADVAHSTSTVNASGSDTDLSDPPESAAALGEHSTSAHTIAGYGGKAHNSLQRSESYEKSRLIATFTFENLIVGKANDLARAAAVQIANNPGYAYNPLFIYGGAGLGKTHLIHAIGNQIVQQMPEKVVRYAHAEDYYTDVVRAYQQKTFDVLKRNYRNLDVLLIDDVQFFNGKGRTQEEFFFVFNALVDAKKQIVITCDTYPKDINGLDHRLVTRFDWGLTVQIEPPETEMRVAILKKKAEVEQINLDDQVAYYIAKHLRSNVRELEGALNKVIAYATFHSKQINMDIATDALKDIIRTAKNISIDDIQKTVADYYKIKMADMFAKKRTRAIVRPRHIAMWLCKEVTSCSFPAIGEAFGGRDHTTVIHAVKTIQEEKQHDPVLAHDLHVLVQILRGS